MIVINEDGAYMISPWKKGFVVRAKNTDDIRNMMTRIHGKKWVIKHLSTEIIAVPKTLWRFRIVLKGYEWNSYMGSVSKAMDYTDLFEHLSRKGEVKDERMKRLYMIGIQLHKGWSEDD